MVVVDVDGVDREDHVDHDVDDVDAALKEGNLVKGYDSEAPTMYVFKKKAPYIEYIRSILTCGIWVGLISVLIIGIIRVIRKR